MSDLKLNSEFETPSRQDWETLVKAGLKGLDIDTLVQETDDGLAKGPLSTRADRPDALSFLPPTPSPLLAGRAWHICAPIRDADIAFANKQLLDDLKGGASALDITLGEGAINLRHSADLKRLLEGVHTELVPIRFTFSDVSASKIKEMARLVLNLDELENCVVNLGLDPVSSSYASETLDEGLLLPISLQTDQLSLLCINAAIIHDAGGSEAQELSYMAASLAYYYRHYGPNVRLSVRLAANQDAHLGIAKIRAARRILNRIAESFGAQSNIPIHSVSALRMMQTVDPWTNLLRIMTAGFGAIGGGAEYITLRPFTDADTQSPRNATPFGYRIARNMQIMMMEESHLAQVQDAAYGSYFHERMTEALAQTAWTEFQALESGGGIIEMLTSGIFQKSVQAAKANREAENKPILGVTLHPAENVRPAKFRENT